MMAQKERKNEEKGIKKYKKIRIKLPVLVRGVLPRSLRAV